MPSDVHDIQGERFVMAVLDMAEAVDLRFSGSARHSETVGRYAEMTARELGLPEWRISRIRLAGILHDIGKAGVPNSILHKPEPLNRGGGTSSSGAPSPAGRPGDRAHQPVRRARMGGDAPRAPRRARLPARPARRPDPPGGPHSGRRRRGTCQGDDQQTVPYPRTRSATTPPWQSCATVPPPSSTRWWSRLAHQQRPGARGQALPEGNSSWPAPEAARPTRRTAPAWPRRFWSMRFLARPGAG